MQRHQTMATFLIQKVKTICKGLFLIKCDVIKQLTRVNAENLDGREGGDDPDPKTDHVRDGSDRDGDGRVLEGGRHPLRYRRMDRGPTPCTQHDKCIIDSDSCKRDRE